MYGFYVIIGVICSEISQRYVLAMMCMCGYMLTTINELTFITMMKDVIFQNRIHTKIPPCPSSFTTNEPTNRTSVADEVFWGTDLQVYISIAHPLGYFLSRLPVGLATDWMGAKTLYGYSVFIPGVLTLITPLCTRTSPYAVLVCRIINGMFCSAQTCSIAYFAARWFPVKDLGFMLSLVYLGFPLGCAWQFHMSFHAVNILSKWVTSFYINGVLSVIWAYVWQAAIWEDPFEHPCVSMKELVLLAHQIPMYAKDSELKPGWSWPWKAILTSTSVWTLALADVAYSGMFCFVVIIIPTWFFPEVFQSDFTKHAKVAIFVFLLMGVLMVTAGIVSDRLIKARIFNVTHVTKIYFAISCVLGSGCVLALTHSGCIHTTAILYFICAMIFVAIGYSTYIRACIKIAPNFVGIVVGLTSMMSVVSMPLEVYIANQLTLDGTFLQWRNVSYIFSAVIIFTVAIFLQWGSCNLQPWNKPPRRERGEVKKKRSTISTKSNYVNVRRSNTKEKRASQITNILQNAEEIRNDEGLLVLRMDTNGNIQGDSSVTEEKELQTTPKNAEELRNDQGLGMDINGNILADSSTIIDQVAISSQTDTPGHGVTILTSSSRGRIDEIRSTRSSNKIKRSRSQL